MLSYKCRQLQVFLLFVAGIWPACHAAGATVYAVSGGNNANPAPSTLYQIDSNTGIATKIGNGIGVQHISGIAFSPDGRLFGIENSPGTFDPNAVLHQIDLSTGAAIDIENSRLTRSTNSAITDIAFRPDGTLYGWLDVSGLTRYANTNDLLVTIDSNNGEVADLMQMNANRTGLSFTPNGDLFVKSGDIDGDGAAHTAVVVKIDLDEETGLGTISESYETSPLPVSTLQAISNTKALTVEHAPLRIDADNPGPKKWYLGEIDLLTGAYVRGDVIREPDASTPGGFLYPQITALAVPVSVPEPNAVLLLALSSATLLARRRR